MGAREVGLARVPVFILIDTVSKDADGRIVHQMVANDQRAALTGAQRARAIQTMLDTGISPTKVAKQLSIETKRRQGGCGRGQVSCRPGGARHRADEVPGSRRAGRVRVRRPRRGVADPRCCDEVIRPHR